MSHIVGVKGNKKQTMQKNVTTKQAEHQFDTCSIEEDAQSEILCHVTNLSQDPVHVVQGLEFHYHDKYVVPDQTDIETQDVASMPSTIASIIKG